MAEATLVRSAADQAKQAGETEQRYQARLRSESILQARKRREAEEKRRAPVCGGSISSQRLDLTQARKIAKDIPGSVIQKNEQNRVSGHQEWLRQQKISAFCTRYQNKDDLVCDLVDIVSENTAVNIEVQRALQGCGLNATEVLAFLDD